MQAVQFFLFGILLVWLVGTGKLAAFIDALRKEPAPGSGPLNPPTGPSAGVHPCSDDPSKLCITDEHGNELHIMG